MSRKIGGAIVAGLIIAVVVYAAAEKYQARIPQKYCGHRATQNHEQTRRLPSNALDDLYFNDTDVPIPDNPGINAPNDTAVSVINIPDDIPITDLNVRLIIDHTWIRDLYITLTGPDDTTAVVLLDLLPQDNADTLDGWFNDEAAISIMDEDAPLIGVWRPLEELSVFDDRSAQGNWTLRVWDRFHLDTGYVAGWGIEVNPAVALLGTVTNAASQQAISGVSVMVLPDSIVASTNAAGLYSFDLLDPDTYSVRFAKQYYDTLIVPDVIIESGQTDTLDAQLVQNTSVVNVISQDFNRIPVGSLPAGWYQVDVDQGTQTDDPNLPALSVWQVYPNDSMSAHSDPRFLMNHYNTDVGGEDVPNDDWLILPKVYAPGTDTLRFWASSQQAVYLETIEIRVSTTGDSIADFTELLGTIQAVPVDWTEYEYSLTEYAADSFRVAFHYISVDMYVIKLDDIVIESVTSTPISSPEHVPTEFAFLGNYPNPFNSTTRFRFELGRESRVDIVLFNTLGQHVASVTDGLYMAGPHEIQFDARGLASGIYFARFSAANSSRFSKVVLIK